MVRTGKYPRYDGRLGINRWGLRPPPMRGLARNMGAEYACSLSMHPVQGSDHRYDGRRRPDAGQRIPGSTGVSGLRPLMLVPVFLDFFNAGVCSVGVIGGGLLQRIA